MSSEELADGAVIAPAPIELCNETHRMRFFCQKCDRLFCGDCCTLAHRRQNRDHDVDEMSECLAREDAQIGRQMEELSRLAEAAEAAANTRDQKAFELIESLAQLIAEVERLLMISSSTREAQQLRRINQNCISILQQVDRARLALNPVSDPVSSFRSRSSINAFLKEQLQRANQTLNSVPENRQHELVSVILKSMVKLVGKQRIEEELGNIENVQVFCAESAGNLQSGRQPSLLSASSHLPIKSAF